MTQQLIQYVSDGFEKAKAGNALDVYQSVSLIHDRGELPSKSHYPFGWIIYYALHQAADTAIDIRKRMLARYLKLNVVKPHKLHSMILTEAIRLYKNAREFSYNKNPRDVTTFSIIKFTELWNPQYLRPGDWRRKELDGKILSSTAEKLLTHLVDEAPGTSASAPTPPFISELADQAIALFPGSPTLLYQRASLHILEKDTASALTLLKEATLGAPSKYYFWSRLASLINPEEDLRLHISLLYKALSAPGPEQFKGKIRIALAKAWISINAFSQALWELSIVKRLYESNTWHLSPDFNKTMEVIPAGTQPCNPENAYQRIRHLADDFVYESLPPLEVKKTYHKNPVASDKNKGYGASHVAWRVTDKDGNNFWLHPHRFKIPDNLPLGTPLIIRLHNGKPAKAELAENTQQS
ncbi:MAG: hypothetical protein K2K58_11990 [Muribaculaceae bacterium]|nr:hypothetical protein [Muribaculaceae bacterium]